MKKYLIYIIFCLFVVTSCDNEESPESAKAKDHFLLGNALYKQKEYKKAISEYNKALKLDNTNAMVYLKRGDSYRKLRKSKNAINDYTRVLRLRPTNARAWHHRGTLKIKMGQKRDGCKDVKKAKELCYVPAEKYYNETCL